jgi:hypothetical protein
MTKKRTKIPILESELQSTIVEAAAKLGWLHYHTYNSQRSDFGYPDLTLVHDGKKRVMWVECKSDSGKVTPEQTAWHDALARADQEVYLVFPKHLDEIIEILMLPEKPTVAQRMTYDSAIVYRES